jgi:hypothetical protein
MNVPRAANFPRRFRSSSRARPFAAMAAGASAVATASPRDAASRERSLEHDRTYPLDQNAVFEVPAHRLGQNAALDFAADPDHIVHAVLV